MCFLTACSYHVGTGGDDHTVDIWDIRRRGRIYTVPAHTNLVSHLKFQSKSQNDVGETNFYEQKKKIFFFQKMMVISSSLPLTTALLKFGHTLAGPPSRPWQDMRERSCVWTSLRVSQAGDEGVCLSNFFPADQQYFATASFDRTFKLWECD